MIDSICKNCSKVFQTYPSKLKQGRGKYCSKECAKVTLLQEGSIVGKSTQFKKGFNIPIEWRMKWLGRKTWNKDTKGICKPNSTSFKEGHNYSIATQYKVGNTPWSKINKELMPKLDKHPNWKGGVSFEPYPLGWNKTFKEQIRYRDGYKCRLCSVSEVECGSKLSVHHIDYNKSNLDHENLISLCKICHGKTNFNRDYWIALFKGGDANARRE